MNKFTVFCLLLLSNVYCAAECSAQTAAVVEQPTQVANPTSPQVVFLIFTNDKPENIIVLDATGKWMPDVRSVTINMVLGQTPTCECVMWSGPFKPSNPTKAVYSLKQAKSVTTDEFKQMVDDLQSNPSALTKK